MSKPWLNYIASGLDQDAARWLGDGHLGAAEDARPLEPFLALLPPEAVSPLVEWDRRARAGTLPLFRGLEEYQYGQDLAEEGIAVLDDDEDIAERVWPLGHDGAGNLYLVLASGAIRVWEHESGELGSIAFPSLDAFAWALVRLTAASDGAAPADEMAAALAGQEASGFRYFQGLIEDEA